MRAKIFQHFRSSATAASTASALVCDQRDGAIEADCEHLFDARQIGKRALVLNVGAVASEIG